MSETEEQGPPLSQDEPAGQGQGASPDPSESGLLAELLEADAPAADIRTKPEAPPFGMRVGRLVAWAAGRGPLVEFPGNHLGPLAARSALPLDPKGVSEAIAEQRGVLLTFEDGKPEAPIITGLLHPMALDAPAADPAPEPLPEPAPEPPTQTEAELELDQSQTLDARVDGRRVEIEAEDEIVLRCGKASIVLRRNGRVVIRGTYVETRSRGVNRIKGGSVEIN